MGTPITSTTPFIFSVVVMLLLSGRSNAQVEMLSDRTLADWSTIVLDGPLDGQASEFVGDGGNSGGSPDPFRSVTTNTNELVLAFHSDPTLTYSFERGAIERIDFPLDFRNMNLILNGQRLQFALEQDGSYFVTTFLDTVSGETEWANFSISVSANNFARVLGNRAAPDFSADGGQITFGFATSNRLGNTIRVGYDNWSADLVLSVPETLTGDVNMDGIVDFSDIGPFIAILQSGEFQAEADIDQNGEVNFADIPPFIVILISQ